MQRFSFPSLRFPPLLHLSLLFSLSLLLYSPFNILPSTFSLQHSPFNVLPSTFSLQHSPFNIPSTFSLPHSPFLIFPNFPSHSPFGNPFLTTSHPFYTPFGVESGDGGGVSPLLHHTFRPPFPHTPFTCAPTVHSEGWHRVVAHKS